MSELIYSTKYPKHFALHQKYAQSPGLLELVWMHSVIIADIAYQLWSKAQIDKTALTADLVIEAALTHEIGVYQSSGFEWLPEQPPMTNPYSQHTIVGAYILKQEAYHPEIVACAFTHAGIGRTKDDITQFGIQVPIDDYMPQSMLQQLLAYAGKFHSKEPRFRTVEEIREGLSRYGEGKLQQLATLEAFFGKPAIELIEPQYKDWHARFLATYKGGGQGTGPGMSSQAKLEKTTTKLNTAGIY